MGRAGYVWMTSPECSDVPLEQCTMGRGWWENLDVASCILTMDDGKLLDNLLSGAEKREVRPWARKVSHSDY